MTENSRQYVQSIYQIRGHILSVRYNSKNKHKSQCSIPFEIDTNSTCSLRSTHYARAQAATATMPITKNSSASIIDNYLKKKKCLPVFGDKPNTLWKSRNISSKIVSEWWIVYEPFDLIKGQNECAPFSLSRSPVRPFAHSPFPHNFQYSIMNER